MLTFIKERVLIFITDALPKADIKVSVRTDTANELKPRS